MKTFKDFVYRIHNQLNEAVPEHLRRIPGTWNHHGSISDETKGKITSALGPRGFKMFPLQQSEPDIDPDVAEHLTKHNWQVTDYGAGMASKKTMTTGNAAKGILPQEKTIHKKIGAILDDTGAEDHVKKSFMNDPARKSSSADKSKLSVLVTTTPHGLASGTVGSGLDGQTCMNIERGVNRHYMPFESEHATHMAALVSSDDKGAIEHGEPDHVIAREFWKQHTNPEHGDIFRPEGKRYGSSNSAFENTSARLATELYPAKAGVTYHKSGLLYNDNGNTTYLTKSKKDIEDAVHNGTPIVDTPGSSVDKELIDHAINHYKNNKNTLQFSGLLNFHKNMANIGNLSSQHVAALHKLIKEDGDSSDMQNLAENHGDKLSTTAINDIIGKTKDVDLLPTRVLMNSKLPQDVIDKLSPIKYHLVKKSLLQPRHYNNIVDFYSTEPTARNASMVTSNSGHYTKEQIKKLIHTPNVSPSVIDTLVNEPNFDKSHHDDIMKNTDFKYTMTRHSKFSKLDGVKITDSNRPNPYLEGLINNKNIPEEEHKKIKDAIVNNDNKLLIKFNDGIVLPDHITKHFSDNDYSKMAKKPQPFAMDSIEHANKHLSAIMKHISDTDNLISEHIKSEKLKNPDFDENTDSTTRKLKSILQDHVATYSISTDTHIDNLGKSLRINTNKKSIKKNLNKLKSLKNYDVSNDGNINDTLSSLK